MPEGLLIGAMLVFWEPKKRATLVFGLAKPHEKKENLFPGSGDTIPSSRKDPKSYSEITDHYITNINNALRLGQMTQDCHRFCIKFDPPRKNSSS